MKNYLKIVCDKYNFDYKFSKFLFVGALNTAFAYTIYSAFLFLGAHYALAAVGSTILGVLFNFKTTGSIVFKNSDNSLLLRFICVYCVTCSLNVAFLRIFSHFKFDMYLAGAILVLPIAIVSYFLMKRFVFAERKV